jgi:hypothetical protein
MIPMTLTIVGILLNSFHIVHDQPEYSLETDPVDKLAAERHANSRYFFLQRARILQRQKRIGQYGWLVLAVFVASSWFLYADAVKATTASKQISAIQTFAIADSNESGISLTFSDGSNAQYIVKALEPHAMPAARREVRSAEILDHWQLASARTAINLGEATVPVGIALKMANEQQP